MKKASATDQGSDSCIQLFNFSVCDCVKCLVFASNEKSMCIRGSLPLCIMVLSCLCVVPLCVLARCTTFY